MVSTGVGRRRKTFYGPTQHAVLEQLRALRRATEDGHSLTTRRPPTLRDYLENWVSQTLPAREALGQLPPSTRDSYTQLV
jgi:hypothetical protein